MLDISSSYTTQIHSRNRNKNEEVDLDMDDIKMTNLLRSES